MKRILFSAMLFVSATIALTLNSCKKEETDIETQSASDNSICEGEFTSRMGVINGFAIKEQGVKSVMAGSPTIIIDPADTLDGFPITMILDYGTVGTVDSIDLKTRKGQIVAVFNDSWDSIGTSVTIKLVNYFVKNAGAPNFVQYACDSMLIIHNSPYSFTNNIIGGKCISPSWNLEWACSRTVTQTAGAGDLNPYNDVFQYTGNAIGKNREGKNYTVNVTVPVVKRVSCRWIESGRIELTPEGLGVRTVDYGSGLCDEFSTLTINGNSFTINMN